MPFSPPPPPPQSFPTPPPKSPSLPLLSDFCILLVSFILLALFPTQQSHCLSMPMLHHHCSIQLYFPPTSSLPPNPPTHPSAVAFPSLPHPKPTGIPSPNQRIKIEERKSSNRCRTFINNELSICEIGTGPTLSFPSQSSVQCPPKIELVDD